MTVTFRQTALDDLRQHDRWRDTLVPPAPPIRHEIAAAIIAKISGFPSFDALPYPLVSIKGQVLPLKRCLVDVRSKRFVVFVNRGLQGQPEIARIRHPRQHSIESTT